MVGRYQGLNIVLRTERRRLVAVGNGNLSDPLVTLYAAALVQEGL